MSPERDFTRMPQLVDPAACTATHAAPPQPFAPAAEDPSASWAQLQHDAEG